MAAPPAAGASTSIAELVGSSKYTAIADDSLKDEDNAAWVMFLPKSHRRDYIELISWIRQIDRMAENEWTEGWGSRFQIFKIGWRTLLLTQLVLPDDYHAELLMRMRRRWFSRNSDTEREAVNAWDEYVEAIAEYHRSDMVFETIRDYEYMLDHLGGSMFQVLSFLTESQRSAVRAFGVVDLFFNHLRDLPEDTAQGLCYFPSDVLDRFGVDREEILTGSCFSNPGYVHMMRFWLDDYLPHLYRLAADFLNDTSLHFTWKILRHWFLRRHARLQRALRGCAMNFHEATRIYYADVKPNLASWVKESFTVAGVGALFGEKEAAEKLAAALSAGDFDEKAKESSSELPPVTPPQSMNPADSGSSWLVFQGRRQPRPPREKR